MVAVFILSVRSNMCLAYHDKKKKKKDPINAYSIFLLFCSPVWVVCSLNVPAVVHTPTYNTYLQDNGDRSDEESGV